MALFRCLMVATTQLHVYIQNRLLHSVLLLARHFEIQTPIKVFQSVCASELVLDECLCQRSHISHCFEQEWLHLFRVLLWEGSCQHILVLHRCSDVLLQEIVQRYNKDSSFLIWYIECLWHFPEYIRQVVRLNHSNVWIKFACCRGNKDSIQLVLALSCLERFFNDWETNVLNVHYNINYNLL